ncbi:MAG: hypothetical protein V1667_00810 [bacterium]
MRRKQKVFIFLLLILFFLILYLILTSESAKLSNNPAEQANNENSVSLENEYKLKTKECFSVFENLADTGGWTPENTAELKNKLLDLKVPAQFKDLHIKFIMALAGVEDYLIRKNENGKSASLQAANQMKADYSWLN